MTSIDAPASGVHVPPPGDRRDPGEQRAYEELAERLIPVAADLVVRVRDEGRESIGALLGSLSERERHALPVVLAAMVPHDRGVADLLDWVPQPNTPRPAGPTPADVRALRPCGTHAAFARHKANGEPVDELCAQAERGYQSDRKRAQRSSAAAGPPSDIAHKTRS